MLADHPALASADWKLDVDGDWSLEVDGIKLLLKASDLLDFERVPPITATFTGALSDLLCAADDEYGRLSSIEKGVKDSVSQYVSDQRRLRHNDELVEYIKTLGSVRHTEIDWRVDTCCGTFCVWPSGTTKSWHVSWFFTSSAAGFVERQLHYNNFFNTVGEGIMRVVYSIKHELDEGEYGRFRKWTASEQQAGRALIVKAEALCLTNLGPA